MAALTAFHCIAAARGDGLLPKLLELLEFRALTIDADPAIVDITVARGNTVVQAGPNPAGSAHGFLPGNVIPFQGKKAATALPARKISAS